MESIRFAHPIEKNKKYEEAIHNICKQALFRKLGKF